MTGALQGQTGHDRHQSPANSHCRGKDEPHGVASSYLTGRLRPGTISMTRAAMAWVMTGGVRVWLL
jgi:hypothetical protein